MINTLQIGTSPNWILSDYVDEVLGIGQKFGIGQEPIIAVYSHTSNSWGVGMPFNLSVSLNCSGVVFILDGG